MCDGIEVGQRRCFNNGTEFTVLAIHDEFVWITFSDHGHITLYLDHVESTSKPIPNIPPCPEFKHPYINVYEDGSVGSAHNSREAADDIALLNARNKRLAVIRLNPWDENGNGSYTVEAP